MTEPSAAAWLIVTARVSADRVRPSMPTKATVSALACRLIQLRAVSLRSPTRASAKSTPPRSRPTRSARPPPTPAKALMLLPPRVSTCASTTAPSASVTLPVPLSRAKLPSSWKKPKASITRWPLTRVSAPLAPSRSKVKSEPVPVGTVSAVLPAL